MMRQRLESRAAGIESGGTRGVGYERRDERGEKRGVGREG